MRRLGALAGALAFMAATAGWSNPTPLSHDVSSPASPQVGVDASGRFMRLYPRANEDPGPGPALVFAAEDADGSFAPDEELDPGAGIAQFRFAVAPDGSAIALWCVLPYEGERTATVRAAVRPPGGSFGEPQELLGGETRRGRRQSCDLRLALGAGGHALALWQVRANGRELAGSAYRLPGRGFGPSRALPPAWLADPGTEGVGLDARGRGWILEEAPRALLARRVGAGGAIGPARRVARPRRSYDVSATLAVAASGRAALAWSYENRPGGAVGAAFAPPRARRFGPPRELSPTGRRNHTLAIGPNGDALVAWRRLDGSVETRMSSRRGGRLSPLRRLAGPERLDRDVNDRYFQQAAVDGRGRGVVAWLTHPGAPESRVHVRPLDAHLRPLPRRRYPSIGGYSLGLALAASGDAVVAWDRRALLGSRVEAAVRRGSRGRFGRPVAVQPRSGYDAAGGPSLGGALIAPTGRALVWSRLDVEGGGPSAAASTMRIR